MVFSTLALMDLAFRSAAIGQLVLLAGVGLNREPATEGKLLKFFAVVCSIAYLLLTAPIPDAAYGAFRNVLLVLTDAWAYALWLAAMYQFQAHFSVRHMPSWAIPVVTIWLGWHLYFFGYLGGDGTYHDINHGLAILVLLHLIYTVLKGLSDDLVDSRRRLRFVLCGALAAYGAMLAIDQLWLGRLLQDNTLSLANSVFVFAGVTLFSLYLLRAGNTLESATSEVNSEKPSPASLPPEYQALNTSLDAFIARGDYTQPDLDIASLAAQLGGKEHQLRRLINRQLGFQNFSVFLNHLRIRQACEWLSSPEHLSTPIMNIALDLGYGSIGPFNRAFKHSTGLTPTEYRAKFQNRR
jgi:AraC-like DNA-binding protein